MAPAFYIGWDVGGWNCDRNSKSRDAVVILDGGLSIVGASWRGNLRPSINAAGTGREWIRALFSLCATGPPCDKADIVLAIDTPLGFSESFVGLVSGLKYGEPIGDSHSNPYLYRETERHLFRHGLRPLSAVKDMIGSQATKGMHVLAKFAPEVVACGVWSDGATLRVIEAYPSGCKGSATVARLRGPFPALGHEDEEDALTCALIAYLFARRPGVLDAPSGEVPTTEGWVWVPRDALV